MSGSVRGGAPGDGCPYRDAGLKQRWVPHDIRDEVVDFIKGSHHSTGIARMTLVGWLGISRAKYYQWCDRYGRVNEHNGSIPRDFWLELWERRAIVTFQQQYPLEGYRRGGNAGSAMKVSSFSRLK